MHWLADQNFNLALVRGVRTAAPRVDVVHTSEVGLASRPDEDVLDWAAQHDRIVLTHDRNTMIAIAYARVTAGKPMPGLFVMDSDIAVGTGIHELATIALCSSHEEWNGLVVFLPL